MTLHCSLWAFLNLYYYDTIVLCNNIYYSGGVNKIVCYNSAVCSNIYSTLKYVIFFILAVKYVLHILGREYITS